MPTQDVSIARYFADLPDPRIDRTKKHSLGDILAIALCAVSRAGASATRLSPRSGCPGTPAARRRPRAT